MSISKFKFLPTTLLLIFVFLLPLRVFSQEDWFEKGLKLTRAQQYDEAIEAFTAAIELIPSDFEAYNYRGVARAYRGDYDGAIADYTRAQQLKPDYAEALHNRGYAWVKKGNLSQALSDFSRAIEIKPLFLDAYNSKAWILATSSQETYRNAKEAVMLAKKAVEIKADIDSLDTLAAAYAADGQFNEAITTQKRVIRSLILQEKTDQLSPYLDHLNEFKAGRSLRVVYAEPDSRKEVDKFDKPLETVPDRNAAQSVAHSNPDAGPYPYTIQVSAYRDPVKSIRAAAALAKNGDPVFVCPVQIPGKGDWHRVFIGSYRSRTEARDAAEALKKRKFQYARVMRKPYAVLVGIFDSQEAANETITRLRSEGHIPYSLPAPDRRGSIRLLIGAYGTPDEAKRLFEQLATDGFTPRIIQR